jgi:uncharacterized transporter YbjL
MIVQSIVVMTFLGRAQQTLDEHYSNAMFVSCTIYSANKIEHPALASGTNTNSYRFLAFFCLLPALGAWSRGVRPPSGVLARALAGQITNTAAVGCWKRSVSGALPEKILRSNDF